MFGGDLRLADGGTAAWLRCDPADGERDLRLLAKASDGRRRQVPCRRMGATGTRLPDPQLVNEACRHATPIAGLADARARRAAAGAAPQAPGMFTGTNLAPGPGAG
ncbi:hypothetical protein GCM10018781_61030 [Kitasatospora indigofera]|uniref:Uncharacterized protein n=1 Tax=Kitasatospora indigofera TaxID=67307 RepID=A0A919G9V1_9ACTN|nr:hypothetical protein GCM10018781_61030 [Kitasatospora indigofera]